MPVRRYVSVDEDNARWASFPFRPGDIVISTRSKHGTTWVQMICALLIYGTPDLPAPLGCLSPWLDRLTEPEERVFGRLAAQTQRRFIKTHTPLDGVPIEPGVTYIVVARDPLDAAASLYHQNRNIDRELLRRLVGRAGPPSPPAPQPGLHDWLVGWIDADPAPAEALDSLPGVLWHLADAWSRRSEPNIVLVHYDDLQRDREGEMRRLARRLRIEIDAATWPELVEAASFEWMRARAEAVLPDRSGVLKDAGAFFRSGRSGGGREVLTAPELARYRERTSRLAPPGLLRWLHRGKM
jgi:aryl sulfotransferase